MNRQVVYAGQFNEEWQRYTDSSENSYVEDGNLVIKAIHEGDTHGMDEYTSARLNTANKQTWKYGKIAARIKLPYGEGIWSSFWMLGANIDENGSDTPGPRVERSIFLNYMEPRTIRWLKPICTMLTNPENMPKWVLYHMN
ncbi:glycoside hydrolase family 16 protein [Rhodohalobacter sp. 8-1]|uniref:glycoside hydrolase family 16 protein n=1 Tax=Rhodohalobacter sp. 8-1 TaxID=3131972 RepID=UPI0030EF1D24